MPLTLAELYYQIEETCGWRKYCPKHIDLLQEELCSENKATLLCEPLNAIQNPSPTPALSHCIIEVSESFQSNCSKEERESLEGDDELSDVDPFVSQRVPRRRAILVSSSEDEDEDEGYDEKHSNADIFNAESNSKIGVGSDELHVSDPLLIQTQSSPPRVARSRKLKRLRLRSEHTPNRKPRTEQSIIDASSPVSDSIDENRNRYVSENKRCRVFIDDEAEVEGDTDVDDAEEEYLQNGYESGIDLNQYDFDDPFIDNEFIDDTDYEGQEYSDDDEDATDHNQNAGWDSDTDDSDDQGGNQDNKLQSAEVAKEKNLQSLKALLDIDLNTLCMPPPAPPEVVQGKQGKPPLTRNNPAIETGSKNISWRNFQANRERYSKELFAEFNEKIFESKLPLDMEVTWNKRLLKTAGMCYMKRLGPSYSARIELATKVCDDYNKLRNTLAHEMCHAAAWLVNHTRKPPHGRIFKSWGRKCEAAFDDLEITTCHSYQIHYKYQYQCMTCRHTFGRHSKSVDVAKQVCARCYGQVELKGAFNKDGTPCKKRKPSQFALFVKEHFAPTKQSMGEGVKHGDIMKELGLKYKQAKQQTAASTLADAVAKLSF